MQTVLGVWPYKKKHCLSESKNAKSAMSVGIVSNSVQANAHYTGSNKYPEFKNQKKL